MYAKNKGQECAVEGCTKPAFARGWCQMHYVRWKQHGDPTIFLVHQSPPLYPVGEMPEICTVPDCPNASRTRGLCGKHYTAWREYRDPLGSAYGECPLCGNRYRISAGHHICGRCRRDHELQACPYCNRLMVFHNLGRHIRNGCSERTRRGNDFWDEATCLVAGSVLVERLGRLPTKRDLAYADRADNGHARLFPSYTAIQRTFGNWLPYKTALTTKCRRLLAEIKLREAAEGEGPGTRRWIAGNCAKCRAPVVTSPRRGRDALTCSRKCYEAIKRRQHAAVNRALIQEAKAGMVCSVCGKRPPPERLCLIGPGTKMSHLVGSTAQVKAALAERIPICVTCHHEQQRLQYEAART